MLVSLLSFHCIVNGACKITNLLMFRLSSNNNNKTYWIKIFRSTTTTTSAAREAIDPIIISKEKKVIKCCHAWLDTSSVGRRTSHHINFLSVDDWWCPRFDKMTCPQSDFFVGPFSHKTISNRCSLIHWVISTERTDEHWACEKQCTLSIQYWWRKKSAVTGNWNSTVNIVVFCNCK